MNEHRAPTEVTDLPTAIAIVGMAGRFPLAPTLDHLWRILVEGKEAVTFFSREELLEQGIPQEVLDLPNYVPAAAPVEQVEHFDAAFFGFTPNEAMVMDPQQRLFLECAWEAAEHAGCLGRHSDLRVGVFAGSSSSSYREYFLAAAGAVARRIGEMQAGLLNDRDMLPTQISYRLGLTGISSLVQCGCSTSMLAVHMACQSVLSGECDVALAGGVSIPIPQVAGYVWEEGSVSSPDGHTRSFDARAEGAQGGSGVGVVALRRLQDALDSGDHIHAVIRATAANNDGGHRIGFTAPSVEGQRRVIAESLALAEVDAETIGYVEAHGSATPLGDPIEIAALTRAFRSYTDRRGFCAVGSVKSNVGHLDEAAGIAGLIKATMAVEHGIVPPSLNFSEPNPKIDFAASPFYVNTETSPWPRQEGPRRAGVSSFGLGGTNIHAVLEEAPRRPSDPSRRSAHILPLSAKTAEALRAAEQRLAEHLGDHPDLPVADVAFTLQTGRRELPHRSYVVAASAAEAVEKLTAGDARRGTEAVAGTSLRISFLFPGVGDHHPAMARRLYRQEPVFQRCLDRCAEALKETLGVDLRDLLLAPAADEPGESSGGEPDLRALLSRPTRPVGERAGTLHKVTLAHGALFSVEMALAELLGDWGLEPQAVLGYSLGELVAACVAGVLELPDALRLVAERARLVEELPAGSMLAVPLPRRQVEEYLGAELDLAATDGSHLTVVSGPPPAVQALAQRLSGEGVACLPLEATHAFHSSMMQPAAPALEQLASELSLQPPKIPWISNLTGTWITDEEAVDPRYWACQLVATVRFGEGLEEALDAGGGLLMELGPGGNLAVLARQSPSFGARHRVSAVMGQGRGDEALALRQAVGDAWLAGAPVRWQRLWTGEQRQRRILPTYAFERERHWIDLPPEALHGEALQPPAGPAAATLSRAALEDCVWLPVWEQVAPASPVSEATGPWLLLGPEAETTELAAALRVLGETVVIALAGESFEPLGEHRFRLRPHSAEDIGGLLRELHESRLAPRGIAHLWTLPPTLSADSPFEGWEEADRWLAQGLDSLVALAQALASSSAASSATEGEEDPVPTGRLVVVSSGIQRVFGDEPLTPPKAALLGAVRAVDREVQGWRCRSVDLSAAGASGTELFAGAALARELRSAVSQEDEEIALRGRRRWRREFLQTPLAAADEARPTVRPGGTYWVTGGTQGLGLVLAEALARNPAKGASGASEEEPSAPRLVLLSDVQLPRADEWSTEIQRRGPQAEVLQRLQALRQACSELVVLDLGEQAPETLVAELERRFGIPDGIVHALDSAREGMVQLRGPDDLSAVGTQGRSAAALIDRFSAAREVPDFLLLCASASALTEGLGQIDYGAVSAYQTALAESREEVGGMRVLAVDWGPGRWQAEAPAEARGGGLETLDDRHLEHIRRYGLSAEETGEITLRLLATETVRAVVTAENLPAVIASARRQTTTAVVAELDALRSPGQEASRQQLSSDYVAPRDPVEKDLVQLWEELFGLRPIGVQDSFFELGGHSLLAIQALTRLRERTGIELPMTQLFDTPTIEGLALRIAELGLEDLDDDEMDAAALLLEEVRNLSPEEVQRRLGEAGGGAPLEDPVESSEAEE